MRSSRPDLERAYQSDSIQAEALREILRAAFPGLGSGRTDLYQAFAWANLELARGGGRIGVVMPRTSVNADGMSKWRLRVTNVEDQANLSLSLSLSLSESSSHDVDPHAYQPQRVGVRGSSQLLHGGAHRGHPVISVATCLNTAQWVFDGLDGRYTVVLLAVRKLNPRTEPRGWP